MPDDTIVGSKSPVVQQMAGARRSKKKRPSQIIQGRHQASGEDLERTPGQELIMDVLGTVHEGIGTTKSPYTAPLRGAVSGALVGAKIGEAVKRYRKRKASRNLGEDSI